MTLRPAARLLAAVAAAALAVTGLSACRSDPKVAAYVGDHRYTVAEVKAITDEVRGVFDPNASVSPDSQTVSFLVMRDVFTAYATKHNIQITPIDEAAIVARFNLPPGKRFTKIFAEYGAAQSAISGAAKSTPPSPADREQIQKNAIDINGSPYKGDLSELITEENVGAQIGFKNLVQAAADETEVTVNPRYSVAPFPVTVQLEQEAQSRMDVPIAGENPVTDLPDPAA